MTIDESKAVRYCGSPDPGSAPRRGTSCEVEIIWGDVHPVKPFFRSFRLCAARVSNKVLRGIVAVCLKVEHTLLRISC